MIKGPAVSKGPTVINGPASGARSPGALRPPPHATIGSIAFVLHAHLPWVLTHGRWPHGVEWLYEAAAEAYLPLLDRLGAAPTDPALSRTGARLALSLSPILCEQLADPAFAGGFELWLTAREKAARDDRKTFVRERDGALAALATRWEQFFALTRDRFRHRWRGSLLDGFRELADAGRVELMTTAATHGYLPLLARDESLRAQIDMARRAHRRHFGRDPHGFWLPECAYRPRAHWASPFDPPVGGPLDPAADSRTTARLRRGIDEFLSDAGIRFFVVDAHLLGHPAQAPTAAGAAPDAGPRPIPRWAELQAAWNDDYARPAPAGEPAPCAPFHLRAPDTAPPGAAAAPSMRDRATPAVFLRDATTAARVWSRHLGYPGDPDYLDFHRRRFPGGLRYWRVTDSRSDLAGKEIYRPAAAAERVREHAAHFVEHVAERLATHRAETGRPGFLCVPFDAELFGHWWSEGPDWLAAVLAAFEADGRVATAVPSDWIESAGPVPTHTLREGSWGKGGDHGVWLNDQTAWAWREIHAAEARLTARVTTLAHDRAPLTRALLAQMARELLLLQASDWPFLISTLGARDYAEERLRGHAAAFERLDALLTVVSAGGALPEADRAWLQEIQTRDRPFPDLDPDDWRERDDSSSAGAPRTTAPDTRG